MKLRTLGRDDELAIATLDVAHDRSITWRLRCNRVMPLLRGNRQRAVP